MPTPPAVVPVRALAAALIVGALVLAGCGGGVISEEDSTATPLVSVPEAAVIEVIPIEEEDPLLVEAVNLVESMSVDEKVATLFVVHYPGSRPDAYARFYERLPVSGFLVLESNLSGSTSTNQAFVAGVRGLGAPSLIVAIDQEGGPVSRLIDDTLPGHRVIGGLDTGVATDIFRQRNDLVAALGANVNFGLIADVSSGPESYIHNRTFGTDFGRVADFVGAAVEGRVPGVAQTLKHFPGHGMTTADSHLTIPRVATSYTDWLATHAKPFISGIEAGVDAVMLSHLVVSDVDSNPASLSPVWVNILRQDLGFDGLIVTDDLAMLTAASEADFADPATNAIRAINAGADLIVHTDAGSVSQTATRYDTLIAEVVAAVFAGKINPERLDDAAVRVLYFRLLFAP